MKSAHCIHMDTAGATDKGAPIVTPGTLPHKRATVTAEVLCRLLAGERLTGLEAVNSASTTRLAAIVGYLQSQYGWRIEREDKAAGCRDGRVSWVAVYWLAPACIAAVNDEAVRAWSAEVRKARATLRAKAALAHRAAARFNAAARTRPQPGQRGLFEGEGAAA